MTKQALGANRHRLWAFGQSYDFYVVTTTIALSQANYSTRTHQKNQIVLHCTAGHGSAEGTIGGWNGTGTQPPSQSSANFIVERTLTPQAARPAGGTAEQPDTGIVDAVRVIDEDQTAYHAGNPHNTPNEALNPTSIGIEITNLGEEMWHLNNQDEPSGIAGRHALAQCPHPTNTGGGVLKCNHGRAPDLNRWIKLPQDIERGIDCQAFDDEQYMTLILLLRHLCINHHIPRQFFGRSKDEVFRHWFYDRRANAAQLRLYRSTLHRFRGIVAHRNVHPDKLCPGLLNRNRLFRGIIDEWWLPVQPDGLPRQYYSGPFDRPPFTAGQPTRNYCFRATTNGVMEGSVYHDANLEALIETKSYYDVDQVDAYYSMVETRRGGMFPMGTNKVWHGGVHLPVQDSNPCVFAAASGTIVAARVTSNQDTYKELRFGSQGFVLIKHAIHRDMRQDPHGLGLSINYDVANVVFSLYMHLADIPHAGEENDDNPPWFNIWRRNNAGVDVGMDGDKGKVFAPNIQVSVGDILGLAGYFRGRRLIQFEILSHRDKELQGAPWDNANHNAKDEDSNLICDVAKLESFLQGQFGQKLEFIDPLRVAGELRNAKVFHKSEWALTAEDQVTALIPHPNRRKILWPHIRRFSWVSEAVAANQSLNRDLGDADGMFWHYHPITFMQHMNELVLGENREIREEKYHETNVELSEDDFLTDFKRFDTASNSYLPVNVDQARIRINDLSNGNYQYKFTRADIACMQAGTHSPGLTPPQATRFSFALFEVMEQIHQYYGKDFQITLSYICTAHTSNNALCVMNDSSAMTSHDKGVAADIRPANLTAAECRNLWNSVVAVIDPLNTKYQPYCGMPSQANLPEGYDRISYMTSPANVQTALMAKPQQNVPSSAVAGFKIHLELVPSSVTIPEVPVKLRITFDTITVLAHPGEWVILAKVNGTFAGLLDNKIVRSGEVIKLPAAEWGAIVELPHDGKLEIMLLGVDTGDSPADLGSISLSFDANTNPPWATGVWAKNSSNNSFSLNFKIEWMNQ
jgi:N-acetyl-anhydromuramyl-L-alanine amidase AmpD